MGSSNSESQTVTDEKQAVLPEARASFCQRNKSGNGSFVNNLRNHFHEFIHAPMDENKRCLTDTFLKIFDASSKIFGKSSEGPNEVANSPPVQPAAKN
ncbi:hypothetical protein L6164_027713 [Bauhinia variegata]|uniref:Uncharacterized protein n=1 Tax=Bauhinia variegata TaxID=167791 RepID=A0ACB9LU72_BAUVA|nr:hypothetical protein L6164_027713 [Bauhinia variegata]